MNNELVIFDQILYGDLIPWHDENKPDEKFSSMIGEVKKTEYNFQPLNEISFQRTFNQKTKYYHKLILTESIAYCNKIHQLINEDKNIKLQKYWRNDTLNKKIPSRLKDIGKIVKDRKYDIDYINPKKASFEIDSDYKTETYILHLLKVALIHIYLKVQELYKFLQDDDLLIEEDFYTQFLHEPIPETLFLKAAPQTIVVKPKEVKPKKITFGYNETTTDKLRSICRLLTLKVDFIDEDQTSEDDFIEVMTSKDIATINNKIHLGCETTQFRYIVDKFRPYFSSLTLSNIEKSKLFYSKNGVVITASNLSRNKHHDPKEKTTIDNIFK